MKRIMNRRPRNFGQSFSAAAVVVFSVVLEAVDTFVIVVMGVVVIMSKGLLVEFDTHVVMHIVIVTPIA